MTVHLGQARHQVFAASIDDERPVGHHDLVGRPDRYDALAAHHDGLAFEHALAVHRNDRHVDEGNDVVFIRRRRGGPGRGRQHQTQQRRAEKGFHGSSLIGMGRRG